MRFRRDLSSDPRDDNLPSLAALSICGVRTVRWHYGVMTCSAVASFRGNKHSVIVIELSRDVGSAFLTIWPNVGDEKTP
jgi:hypothetical protein